MLLLLSLSCSTKALSKYTDMVDSISREQLNRLAEATDAARLALKQVNTGSTQPDARIDIPPMLQLWLGCWGFPLID